MAIVTDPDSLNQGTEVIFDTTAKTIEVVGSTTNGSSNIDDTGTTANNGVTLQCLYSFCKEEWRSDTNLIKFPFPFVPITDEQFELIDGWDFKDASSRSLIRTGGWTVKNTSGNTTQIWTGIIGLGSVESDDELFYYTTNAGAATDFSLSGQVNEAIQVLNDPNGDGSYGDGFDYRSSFVMYVREQGQVFDQVDLSDVGITSFEGQVYRFPISTSTDTNISTADTGIDANSDGTPDVAPFSGMSITYHSTAQSVSIGGSNYNFGIEIDGNSGTKEQIYEFVQFMLRQDQDIDSSAGTVNGKTADELLEFVGNTLKTKNSTNPNGGGTGVYISNFQAADTNDLAFRDNTETERTYPFVSAVTLNFNANLQNDSTAKYFVYFTDANGNQYGTSSAILVDNNAGTDVTGDISGASSVQFDFDYDGNVQGGRTAGTDAAITAVAIGTDTAQYVSATGTITRSTEISLSLVSPLERNYENPA